MQARSLIEWYRKHARALPWRQEPRDPYQVLVSEVMLQQTQVDRVEPRFRSFVRRFQGFEELARASEEEVLSEWSGLGYYRRARMLHQLAKQVTERTDGLPRTAEDLEKMPGIGPYTAAAVASLAFSAEAPVIDGNVIRVGARVNADAVDPRSAEGHRRLKSWILNLMENEKPGEVNEALMELGATVCVPVDPACGRCPFVSICEAKKLGRQREFPAPRKRRATTSLSWVATCIIDGDSMWLVRRIDDGPILRGLWLPPLAELETDADPVREAIRQLPIDVTSAPGPGTIVRHNITHRKIDVVPFRFDVSSFEPAGDEWRWVDPNNPGIPTSSLLQKLVNAFRVKG